MWRSDGKWRRHKITLILWNKTLKMARGNFRWWRLLKFNLKTCFLHMIYTNYQGAPRRGTRLTDVWPATPWYYSCNPCPHPRHHRPVNFSLTTRPLQTRLQPDNSVSTMRVLLHRWPSISQASIFSEITTVSFNIRLRL